MNAEQIGLGLMLVATALAVVAALLSFIFKKSDWSVFDSRISTLDLLRRTELYVRTPYAKIAQISGWLALTVGFGTVLTLIVIGASR